MYQNEVTWDEGGPCRAALTFHVPGADLLPGETLVVVSCPPAFAVQAPHHLGIMIAYSFRRRSTFGKYTTQLRSLASPVICNTTMATLNPAPAGESCAFRKCCLMLCRTRGQTCIRAAPPLCTSWTLRGLLERCETNSCIYWTSARVRA